MRIVPCHPLLWPRPLLRRVIVCEPIVPCAPVCEVPLRTYDQNLHLQNVQRAGTEPPAATSVIPFDLRLATLNAQLRAAKSDARRLEEPGTDAADQPGRTINQYA